MSPDAAATLLRTKVCAAEIAHASARSRHDAVLEPDGETKYVAYVLALAG
jgi:hypothetical protein